MWLVRCYIVFNLMVSTEASWWNIFKYIVFNLMNNKVLETRLPNSNIKRFIVNVVLIISKAPNVFVFDYFAA